MFVCFLSHARANSFACGFVEKLRASPELRQMERSGSVAAAAKSHLRSGPPESDVVAFLTRPEPENDVAGDFFRF